MFSAECRESTKAFAAEPAYANQRLFYCHLLPLSYGIVPNRSGESGLTPREHNEMVLLDQVKEENRRAREEDRTESRQRHQENLDIVRQNSKTARESLWTARIAVIVSAIAAGAVLARFLYEIAQD